MSTTKIKISLAILAVLLLLTAGAAYLWTSPSHPTLIPDAIHTTRPQPAKPSSALGWNPATQGQYATSALLDPQNRIWIGTEEQGVSLYQGNNQWRRFTTADGLGDDSAYALAADLAGRIWVGHLHHGVSVFNGKVWQNYDSLHGPLGQHVFRIAVCPASSPQGAGDVWISTELGLSRYSSSHDTWSYITQSDGLPSNQASALSFDPAGNLYLGSHCDGLAIAHPADNYSIWKIIPLLNHPPLTPNGTGIPGNVINDILSLPDGSLFIATDQGLSRSNDHGQTFSFLRGANWIPKARQSTEAPPPDWTPDKSPTLAEDYIASLAADDSGNLWIGYRAKGYQCLDPNSLSILSQGNTTDADYCAVILPLPDQPPLLCTRGLGLYQASSHTGSSQPPPPPTPPSTPTLPTPASPPSLESLNTLTAKIRSSTPASPAIYLGEDWATQGDWVGRYGRQQAVWPFYGPFASAVKQYPLALFTGPHHKDDSGNPWTYFGNLDSPSPKVLYAPGRGRRILGEWNDGHWQIKKFSNNWDGPDLWLDVSVPQGLTAVSLYTFNVAGPGASPNRRRDYLIEVRQHSPSIEDALTQSILAHARVIPSENPAYRTFLLRQGHYWLRVASNYSHITALNAVFFDQPTQPDSTSHYLGGVSYDPPTPPPPSPTDPPTLQAARNLWTSLDSTPTPQQLPYRTLAYRAAAAAGASPDLLTNWRWTLHLWTPQDRTQWNTTMAHSRATTRAAAATQP